MTTSLGSANAEAMPAAIRALHQPTPRRGFLAGLAALPLIGGSIALLGQPSAVAEPATPDMLEAYKTWLEYERRWLAWEMAGDPLWQHRYRNFADASDRVALSREIDNCFSFLGEGGNYHRNGRHAEPSARAALVLSAVGCAWHDDEACAKRRA